MFTTVPTRVATETATTAADAPGARRPRLHLKRAHVPCDGVTEITLVRKERGSASLTPFTSAAVTEDRFVTVIVQVSLPPTETDVGCTDLTTARSSRCWGGGSGPGPGPLILWFVNVHTTTSLRRTAPSTLVPATDRATVPFRVHTMLDV